MSTRLNKCTTELFDALEPRQLLATFTVTSIADAGAGTLRQAVLDANQAAGADVIEFDAAIAGQVISLTTGQISITDALSIRGTDADGNRLGIAVDAGFTSRIFDVNNNAQSEITVSITDLTLSRGHVAPAASNDGGGAIRNFENLTLERLNINTNLVSTLGLGGAILSLGDLTVRDSSLFGNNVVGNGGAVTNVGTASTSVLTIINSSLYNNTATQVGGAIWQNGAGQASTRLVIHNSTISGNRADTDNNSATENGGGIHAHSSGSVLLTSTIVANNLTDNSTAASDIVLQNGEPTLDPTSANNLIEDAATDGGIGALGNGNITGQDPMLGAPVFAGGPTPTLPLLLGSPAIDTGLNGQSLGIDQRGFARENGASADIGAFETQTISFVISTATDEAGGVMSYADSTITLREALIVTNSNPGADSIGFDEALSGQTITLNGTQLTITDDLTVTGLGAGNLTIDGNAASRVLIVDDLDGESNHVVSISGLTIQNGAPGAGAFGGGIANEEDLTLTDVTVTNNALAPTDPNFGPDFGAGIYNGRNLLAPTQTVIANLTLVRSVVTNNTNGQGGGIYSDGNLSVTDSTISGNAADSDGGGITFAGATMTIVRTTIDSNTSVNSGGGISISSFSDVSVRDSAITNNVTNSGAADFGGGGLADRGTRSLTLSDTEVSGNVSNVVGVLGGGGLALLAATATVSNSTISGNTSTLGGGGVSTAAFTLAVQNSTIAFNSDTSGFGGGIQSWGGTTTLTSSIVSNNTSGAGAGAPDDLTVRAGTIAASSSNNLIGDANTAGGLTDGTNGNLVGKDAMLAPLANNGGRTQTHALLQGSAAIDAGAALSSLKTDQRGLVFARFAGQDADIGAYERQTLALVVDNAGDDEDLDVSAGQLSLREAINASNANPLDDTITFDASLDGQTITLGGRFLRITDDVSITGLGARSLTISGNDASRHFVVDDGDGSSLISVAISDLLLRGGMANNGGSISNDESLSLTNMIINGNTATNDGGAIVNRATLMIESSILRNNAAADSGGAIDNDGTTTTTIVASTIESNTAGGDAGAIDQDAGVLTISRSRIAKNSTGTNGGAIDNLGTLTISDSTLSENVSTDSANGFGGAIRNQAAGTMTITDSKLNGNSGVSGGGAIENLGTATITGSTIANNSAADSGGGIDNFGGTLTITGSTLSGNTTGGSGGAIWTDTALTIQSSTISGNSAGDFGGGIGMFDGTVEIANSTLANNVADANDDGFGQGGAIDVGKRNGAGTLTTTSSIYAGNTRGTASPVADDIALTDGTVSGANNLVQDGATAGGLTSGQNGNIVGVDARLGDLADNGGQTQTHAIYPGSPAFNAGTASGGIATDQRGLARTVGSAPDIGAFEWAPTEFSLTAPPASLVAGDADPDDTQNIVARNVDGDWVFFRGSGTVWQVQRLRDYTDAPAATGDALIWTDPADGLTYVAGPTTDGFLLFQRSTDGFWTYRNLSTELGLNGSSPVTRFTQFTTRESRVSVAGYSAANELVLLQQTGETGERGATWSVKNLSDDLTSQDMATPNLVEITSYVTPWDQWTIAGIDADGQIQGVWVFEESFTTWRVDNLSALFGSPALTGQLTVIQTPWNAINLSGSDADGNLIVTWWVPRFKANWAVNNLTDEQSGTRLANGRITGFVTPWGAMNYAGLDANGEIVAYWWTPRLKWNVNSLTEKIEASQERPTGTITNHVSAAGTMNVLGTSDDGSVTRLSWSPGENQWKLADLTDLAIRV